MLKVLRLGARRRTPGVVSTTHEKEKRIYGLRQLSIEPIKPLVVMDATTAVLHSGNIVRPTEEIAAIFTPIEPFDSLCYGNSEIVTMEGINSNETKMALFSPKNVEPAVLAQLHEPHLHFLSPPKPEGDLGPDWKVHPQFCSTPQRFGVEIKLEPGSHVYGGGEQVRQLCLNNTQFITWNTDIPYYSKQKKSLYQSHPFLLVLRPDGSAYGILANSTYPLFFEMTDDHVKVLSHTQLLAPVVVFMKDFITFMDF
jgi:hypothetical protein